MEGSKGRLLFKKEFFFHFQKQIEKSNEEILRIFHFIPFSKANRKIQRRDLKNLPFHHIFKSKPKNPTEKSQKSSIFFHFQEQTEKSNGEISRIFHFILFSKANRKIQWRDLKNLPFYSIFFGGLNFLIFFLIFKTEKI